MAVDLLLVVTPGADWAYVIAVATRRGPVVPAVAGLVAGYAAHTVLVVAGVAVVVATTPPLMTALTALGSAYLIVLGAMIATRSAPADVPASEVARSGLSVALGGAAISGLNPKGLLLFVALLPQFVDVGASWPAAAQAGLLGGLHMANCGAGYLVVGAVARRALSERPVAARRVSSAAGGAMIAIGTLLLLERLTR